MQARVWVRSARQDLCHRYAVELIVSGIDMRTNAYRPWIVFKGVCILCTSLLFEQLLPGLKKWSQSLLQAIL